MQNVDASGSLSTGEIASRLLTALEARMFVTPTLRRVIQGLPDTATSGSDQVDAVVGLVVLNAWICLSDAALDLLRDLDQATGHALQLFPRDRNLPLAAREDAERAHAEAVRLATKLGFSPGHRTRVAQVVQDCARAVLVAGRGRLDLRVLLRPRRGLEVEGRLEAPRRDADGPAGSAPWLSPGHVRQIADDFEVSGPDDGPLRIRAVFRVNDGSVTA